jgi:hypothetical protein
MQVAAVMTAPAMAVRAVQGGTREELPRYAIQSRLISGDYSEILGLRCSSYCCPFAFSREDLTALRFWVIPRV